MKKNNEELKHRKKEVKLTKKNYIIIVVPIVLILLIVAMIAFYVFIIDSPQNNLKKYLEEHNYTCNKESCSISVNDTTEVIDYKTGVLTISNIDYTYMINKNYVSYQDNINELVCTYRGPKYEYYKPVDASFTTNTNCELYIKEINKTIDKYNEIFTFADIDVNQLEK